MSRAKPANRPMEFELLDREQFLERRLKQHGVAVQGASTTESRREIFRQAILERGLEFGIVGKDSGGKCLTYAQAFERTYGEPLAQKPGREGKGKAR